jgi:uncharacterized protein (DUF1697 family)
VANKTEEAKRAKKTRYIALLRGINVGGHTVKMDRLKKLFEETGLKKVETFIASGNVIFESAVNSVEALEKKVAGHLEKALGYAVATFIRTDAELARIAAHPAFPDRADHSIYIAFLGAEPSKESQARLMKHRTNLDDFHVHKREAYWLCRTPRMSDSGFFKIGIEKALGMPATVRNSTTVAKLVEKYPCEG